MSKNGLTKNYRTGTKNNWRRRIWNEISRRIEDRDNAIVLYLAGPQDLDRKIMVEHGFNTDNLIIVERIREAVEMLRDEGKVVIHGDLFETVRAWPPDGPKISVIIADLCCGLEKKVAGWGMWIHPATMRAVFLYNFQRGREYSPLAQLKYYQKVLPEEWAKNRAAIFMNYQIHQTLINLGIEFYDIHAKKLSELMNPAFYSYHSGNLMFDSCLFQSPARYFPKHDEEWTRIQPPPDYEKRQVSAAIAIRTMRMSGHLPHQPEA